MKVWEESAGLAQLGSSLLLHWTFSDGGSEALDARFAPCLHGFKLCACYDSGMVVVYDLNIPFGKDRVHGQAQLGQGPANCCSWAKEEEGSVIAVGTGSRSEAAQLLLWHIGPAPAQVGELALPTSERVSSVAKVTWAALNGRSSHLLAAIVDGRVFVFSFALRGREGVEVLRSFALQSDARLFAAELKWNYNATLLGVSYSNKALVIYRRMGEAYVEFKRIAS